MAVEVYYVFCLLVGVLSLVLIGVFYWSVGWVCFGFSFFFVVVGFGFFWFFAGGAVRVLVV